MERHVETERVVIPPRPLRAFAREAAHDLSEAIATFEQWMGHPFGKDSRFQQAVDVLAEIASAGQLPSGADGRRIGLNAFELALDAFAVAQALPTTRVADLRRDLETCGRGTLVLDSADLQPVQAQSQLIIRAALHRAGTNPSQPTYSGSDGRKKPDLLVENGTVIHAIEVKRPSNIKNVVPRARDAAGQLRNAGLTGAIVIDVTDCLTSTSPAAADDEVLYQASLASKEFFADGAGWLPGYGHVLTVGVMARPAWALTTKGPNEGQVMVHSTSCFVAFGTARGALDHVRAQWLRSHLMKGINRLGNTSSEFDRSPGL